MGRMEGTLGFDVYGTLIDPGAIVPVLKTPVGERAETLAEFWRAKQLEYSFRRGLMRNYRDFSVCSRQALEFACLSFGVRLSADETKKILEATETLPAFPEVRDGLERCQAAGFRLFAFSNGSREAVRRGLHGAALEVYFQDIISVDEIRSYKPDPEVYAHFLRRTGCAASQAWLISSNPFDVIGAVSAGLRAAWVKRSAAAVFDPWDLAPTLTVSGLDALPEALLQE